MCGHGVTRNALSRRHVDKQQGVLARDRPRQFDKAAPFCDGQCSRDFFQRFARVIVRVNEYRDAEACMINSRLHQSGLLVFSTEAFTGPIGGTLDFPEMVILKDP